MPKIILRGSEYDEVQWDIKSFSPGTIFWKPPKRNIKNIKKIYRTIKIKVPARLNLITLDVTRLCPTSKNLPKIGGAGSVSFAVDLFTVTNIEFINKNEIVCTRQTPRRVVAKHVALLMKRILDYSGGFRIDIKDHGLYHAGLGSTAIFAHSIAIAINMGMGNPLTQEDLIKIITYNYGEEIPGNNMLFPGISTGATGIIALKGGGIIVAPHIKLMHRCDLPKHWKVIIGIPATQGKGISDSQTEIPILNACRHYDRFISARVCHWIMTEFFPAMADNDLKKMGEIAWDIVLTCTNGVPSIVCHDDLNILQAMIDLKKAGVEMIFESSISPQITSITDKNPEPIKQILKKRGFKIIETRINNQGLEILNAKKI